MNRDQVIGVGLTLASVVVIIVYGILVFKPPAWTILGMSADIFMLKLTGFVAVLGVFGILGWIGYTLATTPPPKPIEEIEKELEEELKRLEQELKESESREGREEEKGER